MALPAIVTTDLTGWTKVSANSTMTTYLQAYIDEFYPKYVKRILGSDAFNTINTTTITQKWTDIFDGVFYYNIACDKNLLTDGLTKAIKQLIYFEYVRDQWLNTNTGMVRNNNENAANLTLPEANRVAASRYNSASLIVDELRLFIDNYEDFATTITSSVDNTGTYTINTASTLYLENGDTVKIGSTEYTVSSIVVDTSFVITEATAGLDFSNLEWVHSPYDSVDFNGLEFVI